MFKEELCNREREEGQSSSNQSGSYEAARPKSGQEKRECEEILPARDRPRLVCYLQLLLLFIITIIIIWF